MTLKRPPNGKRLRGVVKVEEHGLAVGRKANARRLGLHADISKGINRAVRRDNAQTIVRRNRQIIAVSNRASIFGFRKLGSIRSRRAASAGEIEMRFPPDAHPLRAPSAGPRASSANRLSALTPQSDFGGGNHTKLFPISSVHVAPAFSCAVGPPVRRGILQSCGTSRMTDLSC